LEARASISKMLGTAIGALGKDIERIIGENGEPQTEIQNAVAQITVDLIKLLASRVDQVLSDPSAVSPSEQPGGVGTGPTKSGQPKPPKAERPA